MEKRKQTAGFLAVLLIILVVTWITGCPFRRLTGIPCPACGMTRAWICLLKGQIRDAFSYHPVFFLAPWILLLMYGETKPETKVQRKRQNAGMLVLLVILMAVYIYRIWLHPSGPVRIEWSKGLMERLYSYYRNLRGE